MMRTVALAAINLPTASARDIFPPGESTPSVIITTCRLPSGRSLSCCAATASASENRERLPEETFVLSVLRVACLSVVHGWRISTELLDCRTDTQEPS